VSSRSGRAATIEANSSWRFIGASPIQYSSCAETSGAARHPLSMSISSRTWVSNTAPRFCQLCPRRTVANTSRLIAPTRPRPQQKAFGNRGVIAGELEFLPHSLEVRRQRLLPAEDIGLRYVARRDPGSRDRAYEQRADDSASPARPCAPAARVLRGTWAAVQQRPAGRLIDRHTRGPRAPYASSRSAPGSGRRNRRGRRRRPTSE